MKVELDNGLVVKITATAVSDFPEFNLLLSDVIGDIVTENSVIFLFRSDKIIKRGRKKKLVSI